MSERYKDKGFKTKTALSLAWGMPWAAAGLALCWTGIGAPLGVLCFGIGSAPMAVHQTRVGERKRAWTKRDRPMPQEEGILPPWLTVGMIDKEVYQNASVEPDA